MVYKIATTKRFDKDYEKLSKSDKELAKLVINRLANDEKLIEHYATFGFTRLPKKQEKFVQNHIKPKYDENCVFMFQNL